LKKILFPILVLVLVIGLAIPMAMPVEAAPDTDVYKSDTTDLIWSGADSGDIDSSGYIVPSGDAVWNNAVLAWVHPSWNGGLTPGDRKAILLTSTPPASWIWSTNPVTLGASYTGDILFVKKAFDIPNCAVGIQATLYITADNGYYFYVNDDWSGTPLGSDGFMAGYSPTNFYYTSDGSTNLGGGENSAGYETAGNLYPLEAGISTALGPWSGIEMYDISSHVQGGSNELQIVAINEHAPPHSYSSNPGGLIYKLVVSYDTASFVSLTPDIAYNPAGTEHTVTATITPAEAGVPITFVVTGANSASGVVDTEADGTAEFTYTGTNAGADTITAYIDCNGDKEWTEGESTIDATKEWFGNFVTGGGNIKLVDTNKRGKTTEKVAWTFGGNVGYLEDGTLHGQFNIVDHNAKESWHCHNDFDSLIFWGEPTDSPPANVDHAQFIGTFTSNRGDTAYLRVTIWDDQEPGRDYDWITIEYDADGDPATDDWTEWFSGELISGGNFQVHEGFKG